MAAKACEEIISCLKKRKLTLAAAESASAGFFSYILTKTAGSSKVFKGGLIVYSLQAKNKFFKLPLTTLQKTQGVSADIALFLAKKVKKLFNADIGVSIVGFAGPAAKKGVKVGTVYIALAFKKISLSEKLFIKGSRDAIRRKASLKLIELISNQLSVCR
ncbi:MAG: CinA family protein [Candidatus Omnitrophica bacterium]|nr:CinA family protein [Candidatus Omnitrophota bacterium]